MSTGIVTKPEVLAAIDALQLRYIGALDDKDMSGWLATFSTQADAAYFLTTAQNVDENLPLGLIHDDNHARLEDRVTFVTKIWAGTYQDYQTRHFVQRITSVEVGDGEYEVKSNFSMLYTPSDTGRAEVFTAGVYLDRVLVGAHGAACFKSKKVINDTPVLTRYLVYPI
jgi:3-phenylpropionate/cinnamic acid dioxygenase small subunit